MVLNIRLLGRPRAEADGREVPGPRGRKAWALLAVLLLADSPPSRRSLAGLLVPDAGDPLGALRWTLSQLRRALRGHAAIGGDPVVVRLGPGCRVDVTRLLDGRDGGTGDGAAGGLDLPEVLLDGADGIAGPDFDLWLTAARHRVDAACGARLRRAAERALAAAEPPIAVTAAARALVAEPDQAAARHAGRLLGRRRRSCGRPGTAPAVERVDPPGAAHRPADGRHPGRRPMPALGRPRRHLPDRSRAGGHGRGRRADGPRAPA